VNSFTMSVPEKHSIFVNYLPERWKASVQETSSPSATHCIVDSMATDFIASTRPKMTLCRYAI
jgi:hypothetical protein